MDFNTIANLLPRPACWASRSQRSTVKGSVDFSVVLKSNSTNRVCTFMHFYRIESQQQVLTYKGVEIHSILSHYYNIMLQAPNLRPCTCKRACTLANQCVHVHVWESIFGNEHHFPSFRLPPLPPSPHYYGHYNIPPLSTKHKIIYYTSIHCLPEESPKALWDSKDL